MQKAELAHESLRERHHESPFPVESGIDRRHFLARAGLAALFSMTGSSLSAQEKAEETESLTELLEQLKTLSNSAALTKPEQGIAIAPVIRRSIAILSSADYQPTMQELSVATDLAIMKLYYSSAQVRDAMEAGASDLPFATLDLEGALVQKMNAMQRGDKDRSGYRALQERLGHDMHWYNCYNGMTDVWDSAATHFCNGFFPEEKPETLLRSVHKLQAVPARDNAVATRVIRKVLPPVMQSMEQQQDIMELQDPAQRGDLMQSWRLLRQWFASHFPDTLPNERSLTSEEAQAFRRWQQERLEKPYLETLRYLLTVPATPEERQEIGYEVAERMVPEKQFETVMHEVKKLGLTPMDVIAYGSIPTKTPFKDEHVFSKFFFDVYKAAIGVDSVPRSFMNARGPRIDDREMRTHFHKNCASVLLSALDRLSTLPEAQKDEEYDPAIGTLLLMAYHGMRHDIQYQTGLPDMEEWGERTGLFLMVKGGDHGSSSDDERIRARAGMLKPIIVSSAPSGQTPEDIPSLFELHQRRLPDDICRRFRIINPERRAAVSGSPQFRDEVLFGRHRFLSAFRRATPKMACQSEILKDWGLEEETTVAVSK
ncbi:hypothetical protein AUJ46_06585 [Candidatus Peregrinibacteria bacterium CG1_02_54_53]|nr:MAG: hypothetical protein AUJ46_06585 [Candidatus Peregrinibacteria bacterium CG1_02_54_53]